MISSRIKNVEGSKSIALASLVAQLKNEGKDIIGLNVGEPDFLPPKEILDATKTALDEGKLRYSLVPGIPELREEIIKRFNKMKGTNLSMENVFVSNGSKQILYNIFQSLCEEGDEVLIPKPYWVSFPESVKLAGATPVFVEHKNLGIDFEDLEKKISDKTKILVINTPNNPSGHVYSKEDIKIIGELALKHDFYIVSDEAYETLIFDENELPCPARLDQEVLDRTITVHSFSKTYCMTGFRVGYMVANKEIIAASNKLQSHLNGNVCTFAQYGALAALTMDQKVFSDMVETFKARRELAYGLFSELFEMQKPGGAFYLFMKIDRYKERFQSAPEMCEYLLKEAGVALLPGEAFGVEGYLRLAYANSEKNITEAFKRIKKVL